MDEEIDKQNKLNAAAYKREKMIEKQTVEPNPDDYNYATVDEKSIDSK